MTFDSLTYARRLKAAGFSEIQAEALADANRDMVTQDLVTKSDLTTMEHSLKGDLAVLRGDQASTEQRLKGDLAVLRGELASTEQRLLTTIEHQTLRMTVRMGVMIGAGIAALGAVLRLH